MPAHANDLEEALKKKGGLTLSQLANYDDVLTDALVDRVYFWSTIRKLKPNFHPSRLLTEEPICSILRRDVIINKDPLVAVKKLVTLPGLERYFHALRSTDEKEHFERHLRKYVNIYLPDCPFEVATTNRYTVVTAEAMIVARKAIKQGEPVKFLTGIQVEMTEKEERELSSRTDFSIVISSRRKRPSLFLGPARFANHDCDSNAKLSTSGAHGIHIVARRNISVGDEITVTYGEDYFGLENCECLCASCEKGLRNGWDPRGPVVHESSSEDESDNEEEKAGKRKRGKKDSVATEAVKAGSLKRKRGMESPAVVVKEKRKVGRPRKVATKTASKAPERLMSDSDGRPLTSLAARQLMMEWLEKRFDSQAQHENAEMSNEVVNELTAVQRKFGIKLEPTDEEVIAVLRKPSGLVRSVSALCNVMSMSLGRMQEDVDSVNRETARLMGWKFEDVPGHYDDWEAGGGSLIGEDHANDELAKSTDAGETEECNATGKPLSEDADEPIPGLFQLEGFTQNGLPPNCWDLTDGSWTSRTDSKTSSYSSALSSPTPSPLPSPPATGSGNSHAKITSTMKIQKLRSEGLGKVRSESSLRYVVNAQDDDDDVEPEDLYDVPTSPEPAARRPPKKPARPLDASWQTDTATPEAPQSSAESTSLSSVFSSGSKADEANSMSSIDDTPDPPDGFEKGSILSDMVNLYTTATPGLEHETMADAEASAEASPAAGATGRLPRRRSTRSFRSHDSTPTLSLPAVTRKRHKPDSPTPAEESADEETRGTPRVPADYNLSPLLLSTPSHRYTECRNCDTWFLQLDALAGVRIACPRCERHSKLYGFAWPKVEREGKGDLEVRVLDWRTIHRYLPRMEESSDDEEEEVEEVEEVRAGRRGRIANLRVTERRRSASVRGSAKAKISLPARRSMGNKVKKSAPVALGRRSLGGKAAAAKGGRNSLRLRG